MPDEILTIVEVAKLLKVADKTVYTMGADSELPYFRVRGQWRFPGGLLGHVRKDFGMHHSPDVFFCQHDVSKATSIALAAQTRWAEEAVAEAIAFRETLHTTSKSRWAAAALRRAC